MTLAKTALKALGLFALITAATTTGILLSKGIQESSAAHWEYQRQRRKMCASPLSLSMLPAEARRRYRCEELN